MKEKGYRLSVVLAATLVACGGEVGDGVDADSIGVAQSEIINGWAVQTEDYTSIVALQVWSTELSSYVTFCTGALMTNDKIITARHCLEGPEIEGRTIYAKMGWQKVPLTDWFLNPDWDVAAAKLSSPMWMWNWTLDRHVTSPPKVTSSNYARRMYSGTNQSLNGSTVLCFGHGGSATHNPLRYGAFNTRFGVQPGAQPFDQVHLLRTNNMLHEAGDSGGPCVNGISSYGSHLTVVERKCFAPDFCYGPGAESWRDWANLAILYLQ